MSDNQRYKPLVETMANEVLDRSARRLCESRAMEWGQARALASQIATDAFAAVLEDAAFYGENAVAIRRLQRLSDAIAAAGGGGS